MIASFSPAEDSIAVDSQGQLQFVTPTLIHIGYQLGVLIRAVSCKIERHFATFADVPYYDPISRQEWEQLWKTDH
jgi:hypothetical protein